MVDFEDTFQLELTNFLKENNSIIFCDNAFTNYVPALKARPGMEIPKNPADLQIDELNKQLAELRKN
jgi:hypothetical protein